MVILILRHAKSSEITASNSLWSLIHFSNASFVSIARFSKSIKNGSKFSQVSILKLSGKNVLFGRVTFIVILFSENDYVPNKTRDVKFKMLIDRKSTRLNSSH